MPLISDTVIPLVSQAAGLAFLLALGFVRLLAKGPLGGWGLDQPNERSLHVTPVPRNGGLGLFAAVAVAWAIFAEGALWAALAPAAVLLALSVLDDFRGGLPVGVRFIAQFGAGAALLITQDAPWLLFPLLLLGLVWMTNLYNFMDGANGLAGGMAVIGFGGMAVAAGLQGIADITLVAAILAAAALGFLAWNFGRAIVFLGDAGSVPLGFLAAGLGIIGWSRGAWSLAVPLMLFAPFIADATLTLIRRFLRGEKLTQAHRTHLYQRLVQAGWSHRRMSLAAYAVMLACVGAGILVLRQPELMQWATLGAVGFSLLALGLAAEAHIARAGEARDLA